MLIKSYYKTDNYTKLIKTLYFEERSLMGINAITHFLTSKAYSSWLILTDLIGSRLLQQKIISPK